MPLSARPARLDRNGPVAEGAPQTRGRRRLRSRRGRALPPGPVPLRGGGAERAPGRRDREPARGDAGPGLGADLPRSVRGGRLLRLHVRAQRHAQLPAPRAREERRHRPHQPDVRVREGEGPLRQPGLPPLGPADLPEGADPRPAHLRRPAREGADDPQGLQGVGGRRLPAASRRDAEDGHDPARLRRVAPDLVGRGAGHRGENARERRPDLRRRGRRREAARAGLRAGDGRGDARRRRAGDQDARRHAAPRRGARVRLLPLREHARAPRPEAPAGGAAGGDRREPRLRQLRVAHRPPARAPDGDRKPDGRLRPLRRRALEAARPHRDELDLHEDARRPLDWGRASS